MFQLFSASAERICSNFSQMTVRATRKCTALMICNKNFSRGNGDNAEVPLRKCDFDSRGSNGNVPGSDIHSCAVANSRAAWTARTAAKRDFPHFDNPGAWAITRKARKRDQLHRHFSIESVARVPRNLVHRPRTTIRLARSRRSKICPIYWLGSDNTWDLGFQFQFRPEKKKKINHYWFAASFSKQNDFLTNFFSKIVFQYPQ